MRSTRSEYQRGIASLHNLMDMLLVALIEVMPGADLARAGAYGWRGYVIRSYKNLASGHYFCQMHPSHPTVFQMEEYYNYGGFYYPWRVDFDLLHTDFFFCDVNRQKAILVDFYQAAVKEALEWQESEKRHSIVPTKLWAGQDYTTTTRLDYPKRLYTVSRDVVTALALQDKLLAQLIETIRAQAKLLNIPAPYIQYNTKGWNYCGFWMKLRTNEPEDVIPEGSFPYHFKIDLYKSPTLLRYISDEQELLLDLEKNYFFSLDDTNREKTLVDFVQPILRRIIQDTPV